MQIMELSYLDRCLKESLRLRPPIMTMMRMAKTPQVIMDYDNTYNLVDRQQLNACGQS